VLSVNYESLEKLEFEVTKVLLKDALEKPLTKVPTKENPDVFETPVISFPQIFFKLAKVASILSPSISKATIVFPEETEEELLIVKVA
jgi:hypothetical protein